MFRSIRWRIAFPFLALILPAMAALGIYISSLVEGTYLSGLQSRLTADARLISDALRADPAWNGLGEDLNAEAQRYADLLGARVTLIAADGAVLGESHEDRTQMDNHLFRPEVQQALREGQGVALRFSHTLGREMMYVAVPVITGGETAGFVRVALPLDQVRADVAQLRRTVLLATLLTVLGTAVLSIFIAEQSARPIRQLTEVVGRMAGGDLNARLLSTAHDEVGTLARAFNQMADRLRSTIVALTEEQERLNAILENMADGVLIADALGRVHLINPAAARLLGVEAHWAMGRSLAEVVRDHRIIGLWRACHERGQEQAETVEFDWREIFLQVVVTPLVEADRRTCLVVLQDLTRVRRLETVRRDFISNISHELRTPLASLKALVETLCEGALEDPPAARRFLGRMETELDALTQMVQELLELSRIESGRVPLRLEPVAVEEIVLPPLERLRPQAERAGLVLRVVLPSGLPQVRADGERVRQVVSNLVHNAIKFTPPGGDVTVTAEPMGNEVLVSVRDTGIGIPAEDLPRIFERFYKADRARSGGGTGLGLAIAKHIVQAHGGRIWAESFEGKGSTFYFSLPVAD